MPTLYVANGLKQNHHFLNRIPSADKLLEHTIKIGHQIAMRDMSTADISTIVDHHAQYGMVEAKKADNGKALNCLLYQIDQPISGFQIEAAIEHNNEVLTERGRQRRLEAAIGTDNIVRETMASAGVDHVGIDIAVIEQSKGPDDDAPKIIESIGVRQEGVAGLEGARPARTAAAGGKRRR